MKQLCRAAVATAVAAITLGTLTVSSASAAPLCPSASVGSPPTSVGVCVSLSPTVDGTTASLDFLVCPYGTVIPPNLFSCDTGSIYKTGIILHKTSLPTIDVSTVTVSGGGGAVATVYVDGVPVPVPIPPYCVSATQRCP